ncbi:hypothetical protein PHLGIDRAFT_273946 [Phlebiopsis gigantea 11061_1 CR5-6]|uniref:NAD-dependent epimerase/dehydratase domain-containing protein n=1 Tax=Phlebiopsis gigantea (strain 11061_1 CR5-6) TaxID=745531 RepID=A0A0C3NXJ7_PHLG1|nr:hypothetical protein PHLGIDRAFT_273946 [Phlebiopsis gigantea 11061_1 CR5-6]
MVAKVVICGAGFLGSSVAKLILSTANNAPRRVQLLSRKPSTTQDAISKDLNPTDLERLEKPADADITKPDTLSAAIKDADVVVSLVGIMHGSMEDFERIQWRGAENVARAARDARAKLIHISAIGADTSSNVPYERTKALGEDAVLSLCPDATVIRPSILFGPGDGFFGRFAQLSKVLPVMPVFGGGKSRFQPVYVEDVARLVEIISRRDIALRSAVDGKTIEVGGPDVFSYREIMELVLRYTNRKRPIVSVPYGIGTMQGFFLERLPTNMFTLTRAQVEQLKKDNIVNPATFDRSPPFEDILQKEGYGLHSVHDILPTYLFDV